MSAPDTWAARSPRLTTRSSGGRRSRLVRLSRDLVPLCRPVVPVAGVLPGKAPVILHLVGVEGGKLGSPNILVRCIVLFVFRRFSRLRFLQQMPGFAVSLVECASSLGFSAGAQAGMKANGNAFKRLVSIDMSLLSELLEA